MFFSFQLGGAGGRCSFIADCDNVYDVFSRSVSSILLCGCLNFFMYICPDSLSLSVESVESSEGGSKASNWPLVVGVDICCWLFVCTSHYWWWLSDICLVSGICLTLKPVRCHYKQEISQEGSLWATTPHFSLSRECYPVSYTHLTLPTKA